MSGPDTWSERFAQLVIDFEQLLLDEKKAINVALFDQLADHLNKQESEMANLVKAELEEELLEISRQREVWRRKVAKAEKIGLAKIQTQIKKMGAERDALYEKDFSGILAVVADFGEKGRAAMARQEAVSQTTYQCRQRLQELAQETEALQQKEAQLDIDLAQWQQKEALRQLRRACLRTAVELQALRQEMQTLVQAGSHL